MTTADQKALMDLQEELVGYWLGLAVDGAIRVVSEDRVRAKHVDSLNRHLHAAVEAWAQEALLEEEVAQ